MNMVTPLRTSMPLALAFLVAACSGRERDPGTEGGRCYPNGTCNQGLSCYSGLCVHAPDRGRADVRPASDAVDRKTYDLVVTDRRPGDLALPTDSRVAKCASLQFDGIDDQVVVANSPDLNPGKGDFTVEGWAMGTTSGGHFIAKRDGENYYAVVVNNPGTNSFLEFWLVTSAGWMIYRTSTLPPSQSWNHVAVQRVAGAVAVYVNGQPATVTKIVQWGTTDPSQHVINNSGYLYVGSDQLGKKWKGNIAELRVTNSAVYTASFTPQKHLAPLASTVALFHFEEGTGTTLADDSGKSNNGAIAGATWSTVAPGCP